MGLATDEEKIELETEKRIDEKLKQNKEIIVVGYPLSGLTTLYLEYSSRFPDRKLCIEGYKYNPDDKNKFTDIMDALRNGQKVALFIPEYTFKVYLDEYLEEHRNGRQAAHRLQTFSKFFQKRLDLEKEIKKYYVVIHTVSKDEAREFLQRLIKKSKHAEKFNNDLNERILESVKQTEKDGSIIPKNTETYPLKLLKDVFEKTQKRFANRDQYDKIKADLDRKIKIKDETEEIFSASILFGITSIGEVAPNLLKSIPESVKENIKQLLPGITTLLGIAVPAFSLFAIAAILFDIWDFLKHRREKKTPLFDKFLQLKEYWDSLNDSERKMLCYKLDKKNKLKPGASEEYLNYIFMNKWKDVENEIKEIEKKLDGFEDRLKKLESEYPKIIQLLNELSQVNESIKLIKNEIEFLKERIERLEEELYSTGAEKIENIKTLKDKLGVQDEEQNLIGQGNSENDKIVKDKINEIISNSKGHVCIIEGEAGSGKTTLLYMIGKSLLKKRSKLYYIVEPSNFSFQKFRDLDAYAIYDARDRNMANKILEKLREDIEGNVPLAKVIISVRTSYLKEPDFDEVRRKEGFKYVYEAQTGYNESILQEMAIRRLKNSFSDLRQDDLNKASEILTKKSEGLPLYIKEAMKMLEGKGFSLELLNKFPRGTANMILSILSEEGNTDSSLIFVYFLVANYPRFPRRLLKYIENFFGIHTPNYMDESSDGKLFLHTWYRDILYSIMDARYPSDIINRFNLSDDSMPSVEKLLGFAKKVIEKRDIFDKIRNNYERPFADFINKYPNNPVLNELNNHIKEFFKHPNSIRPLDLSDAILLSSIIGYVESEIRKNDKYHYGFNILEEKIDYSLIEPSGLDAYIELISFLVNSIAKESPRISKDEIRPFYLFTLIASLNLFNDNTINTLQKEFLNMTVKSDMDYEAIFSRFLNSSYTICSYISNFISALSTIGFLNLKYDSLSPKQIYKVALIYVLKSEFDKAIEEFDKAIELDPNNPDYHNNKGKALYELKRYKEAIKEYNKALRLSSIQTILDIITIEEMLITIKEML